MMHKLDDGELLMLGQELAAKRGWKLSTVGQKLIQDPRVFEKLLHSRKVFLDTRVKLKQALKEELKK